MVSQWKRSKKHANWVVVPSPAPKHHSKQRCKLEECWWYLSVSLHFQTWKPWVMNKYLMRDQLLFNLGGAIPAIWITVSTPAAWYEQSVTLLRGSPGFRVPDSQIFLRFSARKILTTPNLGGQSLCKLYEKLRLFLLTKCENLFVWQAFARKRFLNFELVGKDARNGECLISAKHSISCLRQKLPFCLFLAGYTQFPKGSSNATCVWVGVDLDLDGNAQQKRGRLWRGK